MGRIHPDLWKRLFEQGHAVATFLIDHDVSVTDAGDDRDPMERAADHVVALSGFGGFGAVHGETLSWLLASALRRYLQVFPRGPVRADQMPESTE